MVDFRYHIVSIVAIFVALAVGIVLGAGPLKDASDQRLRDQVADVRSESSSLRDQLDAARGQVTLGDRFASQTAPELVAGRLLDTPVVVVALPGADTGTVRTVTTLVRDAGARVTGTVTVQDEWTDPSQDAAFATALAGARPASRRSATTAATAPTAPGDRGNGTGTPGPGGPVPAAVTTAARTLALALVARGDVGGRTVDPPSPTPRSSAVPGVASAQLDEPAGQAVIGSFVGAGLIRTGGAVGARASLTVLVAGPAPATVTDRSRAGARRLTALAVALREAGSGAVVAGPAGAADTGGVLAAVRADPVADTVVSTVDSVDRPGEAVAVVLALIEQVYGGVGDYGGVGSTDGALPAVAGVSSP